MTLSLPELALVIVLGSAADRAEFLRQQFAPDEIVEAAGERAAQRLAAGRLTVIDADLADGPARQPVVALARRHHVLPVAFVLNRPAMPHLEREGFRLVYTLSTPAEVSAAGVVRQPLPPNRRDLAGPFDIIGDVHGCLDELRALLVALGYVFSLAGDGETVQPPPGRMAIFLGDLVDRGPGIAEVLTLVMGMAAAGTALCVPGNHDAKLVRHLSGKNVRVTNGLAESIAQLDRTTPDFRQRVLAFLDDLVSHYVLDAGRLVVAHGGLKQSMHGRDTTAVREFALYGATTGEIDALGLPVRLNWAADYHGPALVVYGHTPVAQPEWLNGTLNIDTGCVFGGRLTALRYPEKELVSVPAARAYAHTNRPLFASTTS